MQTQTCYTYELDDTDRIVEVDEPWLCFAADNDAADLTRERVVGVPVHDFIAGWTLSSHYARLYKSLRHRGAAVTVPFRCDAPDMRRHMELDLLPRNEGRIHCRGRLLRSEPRPRIPLLDRRTRRNGEWLVTCSLCRQMKMPDNNWREVEEALAEPYAEPLSGLPQLSHDLCPDCDRLLQGLIEAG